MAKRSDIEDGDLPPPYSLGPEAGQSRPQHRLSPRSLTSHLQSQVASVPERIQYTLQERYTQQSESDVWLIDQLAPVIEEFLVDVGAQYTTPSLAVLTLVPSEAVPPDAELSDLDDMRQRGEFGRAGLIPTARRFKKGSPDSKAPPPRPNDALCDRQWDTGSEFTDWGRWDSEQTSSREDLFWWRDECMARRLASYLQPEQPRKLADMRMHMNVKAEEVTFRHANEFGILESLGGWAIVVTVTMSETSRRPPGGSGL